MSAFTARSVIDRHDLDRMALGVRYAALSECAELWRSRARYATSPSERRQLLDDACAAYAAALEIESEAETA